LAHVSSTRCCTFVWRLKEQSSMDSADCLLCNASSSTCNAKTSGQSEQ
jgi:hypothetical protein